MENTCALAVFQEALTVNLPSVPSDGKAHILPSRFREIDILERARRPSRLLVRLSIVTMFHERELDLARFVRLADCPAAAMSFVVFQVRCAVLDHDQKQAGGKHEISQCSTHSHKNLQLVQAYV